MGFPIPNPLSVSYGRKRYWQPRFSPLATVFRLFGRLIIPAPDEHWKSLPRGSSPVVYRHTDDNIYKFHFLFIDSPQVALHKYCLFGFRPLFFFWVLSKMIYDYYFGVYLRFRFGYRIGLFTVWRFDSGK
jgi:hypothetical protein